MNPGREVNRKKFYSFHLDLIVEGYNEAMAKEFLLAHLKSKGIKSFQINGETTITNVGENAVQKPKSDAIHKNISKQIEQFKAQNTLIRLSIVKGRGVTLSVPCRVLNYDEESLSVTIYHVDEKKVYQYNLNEIDDLVTF